MDLVVIPFFDIKLSLKHGFRTRDSHIYEKFIKNKTFFDKLIFINRPTSLIELLLRRKKLITNENKIVYLKNRLYISKVAENVYVVDILSLDFIKVALKRRGWIPYIYRKESTLKVILRSFNILNISDPAIYTSTPFSIDLCTKLNAKKLILDADDNFAEHKEYQFYVQEIENLYKIAKEKFNLIACTNLSTISYFQSKLKPKAKIIHIPNGTDIERFNVTQKIPDDIKNINNPIIGYAGNMQTMFDVKLFTSLVNEHPDKNFVLIGNILDKRWMKKALLPKNVHYLGDKNYDIYPFYINSFDICIIPYIIENQHGGDPMKFYEFMAANKPIVTTNIGSIANFHNGKSIFICNNKREFQDAFSQVLFNLNTKRQISHKIPINITWDYKSKMFINELI